MNIHTPSPTTHPHRLCRDIDRLGSTFLERSTVHDDTDTFVARNYEDLKEINYFSAGVPLELGGGGAGYGDICAATRRLGHYCASTALATAMHHHNVQQMIFRWRRDENTALAEKLAHIAADQLVVVTSGASDWTTPSGEAVKTDGGFRVSGRKIFASGCPKGAVLTTSAPYTDENSDRQVIHYTLPLEDPSVSIDKTWKAQGMRGTGSHDIVIEDFFVPDEAVALTRPCGEWHEALEIAMGCAMPIVMSAYLGVAEQAAEIAIKAARGKDDPAVHTALGEMANALETATLAVDAMVAGSAGVDFTPSVAFTSRLASRKTIATRAVIDTVERAVDVVGGAAFFRRHPLERLQRDIRAARFHPMQEKRQLVFTGRLAAGLSPVG